MTEPAVGGGGAWNPNVALGPKMCGAGPALSALSAAGKRDAPSWGFITEQ